MLYFEYSVALCLTFNWTLRECSILIIALPVSLSRVLLPLLSSLKFCHQERQDYIFFLLDWVGVVYSWLLKYSELWDFEMVNNHDV